MTKARMPKKGPRDVEDISWAIGRFFFSFSELLTNRMTVPPNMTITTQTIITTTIPPLQCGPGETKTGNNTLRPGKNAQVLSFGSPDHGKIQRAEWSYAEAWRGQVFGTTEMLQCRVRTRLQLMCCALALELGVLILELSRPVGQLGRDRAAETIQAEWMEERSNGITVIMERTPQGQKARLQRMCCALAAEIVCLLFQRETGQSGTEQNRVVRTSGIRLAYLL